MSTVDGNYYGGIVKDGLVLLLDAAKRDSYPRVGTTWTDITWNGNNGTLTNFGSQTIWNSSNGGSIIFDGTNDYVSSFPNSISQIGSRTILCFINLNTTNRAGIVGTRPTLQLTGFGFTCNRTTLGNLTYYDTSGSVLEVSGVLSLNTWIQVGVVYDSITNSAFLIKNGVQIGSTATSFGLGLSSSFNGVVGDESESFANIFKGNISNVQIYNRALSSTEILQNYNALKGRFGL
jgi:hypothetical protein